MFEKTKYINLSLSLYYFSFLSKGKENYAYSNNQFELTVLFLLLSDKLLMKWLPSHSTAAFCIVKIYEKCGSQIKILSSAMIKVNIKPNNNLKKNQEQTPIAILRNKNHLTGAIFITKPIPAASFKKKVTFLFHP